MTTNYCPGCNHPVLLRAPDGTCGDTPCREYAAAQERGEDTEPPHVSRSRDLRAQRQGDMVEAVRAEFKKCVDKGQLEADAALETLERLFKGYIIF